MSSDLTHMKSTQEKLRMQMRAINRGTKDTKTMTIEEKRVAYIEIEKLQFVLNSLKEETAALRNKVKKLESTIVSRKEERIQEKKAATRKDYTKV